MLRAFRGAALAVLFLRLYSCDFVQLHSATLRSVIFAQSNFVQYNFAQWILSNVILRSALLYGAISYDTVLFDARVTLRQKPPYSARMPTIWFYMIRVMLLRADVRSLALPRVALRALLGFFIFRSFRRAPHR